ncbi:MAG TPA: hypothetical protein VFY61_17760 [Pyrinomonadaceae bacterium]|nr:hypothetical protein [Pyrinomonadaceae bacterium]
MSGRKLLPRIVFAVLGIVIGSFLALAVVNQKSDSQRRPVTSIPPTYSIVKTIEILSTKVVREDGPGAGVSVEVRNNSDKAVMAIDLVCGEGAITKNGLTDEENPIVVIPPYGTTTIEMTFGEMSPDSPLVISAVTYADGTEEGDEKSLRLMHQQRDHDRKMMKEIRARKKEAKTP